MKKQEALNLMCKGVFVFNQLLPEEKITYDRYGNVQFEDGSICNTPSFWYARRGSIFDDGWFLAEEKKDND